LSTIGFPSILATMPKTVTVRELAVHAGVHFTTAALALRNSPRVSPATRAHVQEIAQRIGYKPNPLVSALMAQRRATRAESSCVLAYLALRSRLADYEHLPHEAEFMAGAQARAEQFGYKLEPFCLYSPGMSSSRLAQILASRGIAGIVVGPSQISHSHLPRAFHPFACVTLGYSLLRPQLHRVTHNHASAIDMACRELRRHGRRRIGLILTEAMDRHVNKLWTAGYLAFHQRLPASERIAPLYLSEHRFPGALLQRWVDRHKPDAIVTMHIELWEWWNASTAAQRRDITVTSLDWSKNWGHCPGIFQKPRTLGAAAVDLLSGQLNRNEHGLPEEPITLMLEGEWRSGSVAPSS
jgi:LacI family transcriptional regulator